MCDEYNHVHDKASGNETPPEYLLRRPLVRLPDGSVVEACDLAMTMGDRYEEGVPVSFDCGIEDEYRAWLKKEKRKYARRDRVRMDGLTLLFDVPPGCSRDANLASVFMRSGGVASLTEVACHWIDGMVEKSDLTIEEKEAWRDGIMSPRDALVLLRPYDGPLVTDR